MKMTLFFFSVCAALLASGESLEERFARPPESSRLQAWWHWSVAFTSLPMVGGVSERNSSQSRYGYLPAGRPETPGIPKDAFVDLTGKTGPDRVRPRSTSEKSATSRPSRSTAGPSRASGSRRTACNSRKGPRDA